MAGRKVSQKTFRCIVTEPTQQRWTGSFIFMHGSGGTGTELCESIKQCLKYDLSFPHLRVVFPTAPLQPYTLLGGKLDHVWFDRHTLTPAGVECLSTTDSMAQQLMELVQEEIDSGIPENRIVIGGFSMGASMALQLGLRFIPNVAAIVSLSTFLYSNSKVYSTLQGESTVRRPPVLFCHGDRDDLINIQWGKETYNCVKKLGVQSTFEAIPYLGHSISAEELDIVKSWVMEMVPDS